MAADQLVCLTVKVWPAIVTAAVLSFLPGGADALQETVPLPVPLAPEVTESHSALLLAVHAQPLPADTEMVPVAAPFMLALVGLIE